MHLKKRQKTKTMKKIKITILLAVLTLVGCNQKPTLERYFVENTQKPNFVNFDLSPSMINTNKLKLTAEQNEALKGFDKMNILVLKKTEKNQADFIAERAKLNAILKDEKYQELMKFGVGKEGASLCFVGDDDNISEFVLTGNKSDVGLALIRITGKDINPNNILKMMSVLQSSNLDIKQLQPIVDMLNR